MKIEQVTYDIIGHKRKRENANNVPSAKRRSIRQEFKYVKEDVIGLINGDVTIEENTFPQLQKILKSIHTRLEEEGRVPENIHDSIADYVENNLRVRTVEDLKLVDSSMRRIKPVLDRLEVRRLRHFNSDHILFVDGLKTLCEKLNVEEVGHNTVIADIVHLVDNTAFDIGLAQYLYWYNTEYSDEENERAPPCIGIDEDFQLRDNSPGAKMNYQDFPVGMFDTEWMDYVIEYLLRAFELRVDMVEPVVLSLITMYVDYLVR